MIFTTLQKISVSVISLLFVFSAVFGVANKQSFNTITTDASAFGTAELEDYTAFADSESEFYESLDAEYLQIQLDGAQTAFVATVEDVKNQYECLNYTVNVDRVVQGDNISANETVVLYEYSHFILNENNKLTYFQSVTGNLPLQKGKQYLIFAEELEYEKGYQENLNHKEYRIFDAEIDTFCISDNQTKPLNINAKSFSEFEGNEYICFTQKGIDNMNKVKQDILDIYLK